MNNKHINRRSFLVASELSIGVFSVSLLFALRQLSIILGWETEVSRLYAKVYPVLLALVGLSALIVIAITIIYPSMIDKGGPARFIGRHGGAFFFANGIAGFLILILLLNTIVMEFVAPRESEKAAMVTVLYDPGSLNRMLVRELVTPLILELRLARERIAILPLDAKNIENGFSSSRYMIILSHGSDGKLYSTRPLQSYSYEQIEKIDKPNIRLIYYSACYLGIDGKGEGWRRASRPAIAILYDRESAALEHVAWIVTKAKRVISELEAGGRL